MKFIFNNRFVNNLPADADLSKQRRQVHHAAYSLVKPNKTATAKLVAYSTDLAESLGITNNDLTSAQFLHVFSGNKLLNGMQPYAMCYGGHQFGHWAGQLGDGRAINLGEIVTSKNKHLTLQLKGAGLTPYSRTADGLAVLRSSVREFLCSEAMYYLNVPTTRALSLCLTGEQVMRDMFYDGNPKAESGAVVCRVSSSFLRFGSFQLPASRGDIKLLTKLVQFCIKTDFPHLLCGRDDIEADIFTRDIYINWFSEICDRTCTLMVHWLRVGFVHGVMNTDNMSIIGETIDYGPYGWIDNFDPNWTPNTTDAQGKRYCFAAQAQISQWNLFQLANAIFPLINEAEPLQKLLENYANNYQAQWLSMMRSKLGLLTEQKNDLQLITELEQLLVTVETDMTLFYRQLAKIPMTTKQCINNQWLTYVENCYYQQKQLTTEYKQQFTTWLKKYIERVKSEKAQHNTPQLRTQRMNAINPLYVLRNYLAQQAIDAAEKGDFSKIHQLQKVLQQPYNEQNEYQEYAQKRPDWAKHKAGCGMLSCSS